MRGCERAAAGRRRQINPNLGRGQAVCQRSSWRTAFTVWAEPLISETIWRPVRFTIRTAHHRFCVRDLHEQPTRPSPYNFDGSPPEPHVAIQADNAGKSPHLNPQKIVSNSEANKISIASDEYISAPRVLVTTTRPKLSR